jgi:endonuclease-3
MSKNKLLEILAKEYPSPKSELNFKNNYQLLVSVVLSAQCTDKKVNQITPDLFKAFPDFKKLSKARISSLEKIIRPINYYRTKAKNLIATGKIITNDLRGLIPQTHDEIINLPGVGRKTANVVLGEMGVEKTFPVDTHVMRVSKRLGLTSAVKPDKVEEELKVQFEPDLWRNLHHWLILHGRKICKAQNPNCTDCPLNKLCPSAFNAGRKK